MKYKAEKEKNEKAYIQIYNQIKADIVSGVLPYGSKLPSKRILSEEAEVSVITVEHAYRLLCDEGYADSRERSGYYVAYRFGDFNQSSLSAPLTAPVRKTAEKQKHISGAFPFTTLCRAMRKVMQEQGEKILVRPQSKGCPELRHAISRYLAASSGINVKTEQIIIGAGAEYLYTIISQLLGRERIFALEDPSYDKISKVYRANGINLEMLPLENGGIKSSALNESKASVLHVTPFNSYPSGITADASKRREYLQFARERNGYIIEDNYDSELTVSTKNEDTLFSLSPENVIYLNTFSRTVAPSFRVGYALLPEPLVSVFDSRLGFYSCTVPAFEQYVLAELIESGEFERHINRVRRSRRKKTTDKSGNIK